MSRNRQKKSDTRQKNSWKPLYQEGDIVKVEFHWPEERKLTGKITRIDHSTWLYYIKFDYCIVPLPCREEEIICQSLLTD